MAPKGKWQVTNTGTMTITLGGHTLHPGDTLHLKTMEIDDVDVKICELRWVITPDLDGPQLQYRSIVGRAGGPLALIFSEWEAVPKIFMNRKLKENASKE